MARTESSMLRLGTEAPFFSLVDAVTNKIFNLNSDSDALATVIMFICNHCPFVKHVNHELTHLANDYIPRDIQFIAINSNNIEAYPDDSPENMRLKALEEKYPFPYLFDETQEVAKAYHAACTPDFFIFNDSLTLVYRGQLDDSRPGNGVEVNGASIRDALDCLLNGKPVPVNQKPSIGCNIKWK